MGLGGGEWDVHGSQAGRANLQSANFESSLHRQIRPQLGLAAAVTRRLSLVSVCQSLFSPCKRTKAFFRFASRPAAYFSRLIFPQKKRDPERTADLQRLSRQKAGI